MIEKSRSMPEENQNIDRTRLAKLLDILDPRIAAAYKGGIKVLEQNYPEKIPQSAHSLREIIYMITRLDEIKASGNVKTIKSKTTRKQDLSRNLDPLYGTSDTYTLHGELAGTITEWFSGVAHHSKDPTEEEFMKKVAELEKLLEQILEPHFEVISKIDILLMVKIPQQNDIDDLQSLLSRNVSAYDYFFQNASANWLPILQKEHYLEDPHHVSEIGGQRKPIRWSPAIYLWKSASQKPKEVAQIIQSLETPKESDKRSPWILYYFVKAVLEMPPEYCKYFAEKIFKEKWLETPYIHDPLTKSISKLMIKFADAEFEKETVFLAEALLNLRLGAQRNFDPLTQRLVEPRMGDYWFAKLLNEEIQHVLEKFPESVTSLCVKRVAIMIYLENVGKGKKESKMDQSMYWRPAINNHEQNRINDFRSQLVGKLGDFLIALGHRSMPALKRLLIQTSEIEYPVFRRLELYVYWSFPEHFHSQINSAIEDNFDNSDLHYEYFHLLKNCFPHASNETRKKYLRYVKNGPSLERIRVWEDMKEELEPGFVDRKIKVWRTLKLEPVKKHLTEGEEENFESLMGESFSHPDFLRYSVGPVVSEPKSVLEDNLIPDEVFNFLSSYAIKEYGIVHHDGTPHKFQEYVSKESEKYSHLALRCFDLDPIFMHSFFRGIDDAIRQKNTIEWEPVLSLCKKIIAMANDEKEHAARGTVYNIVLVLETGITWDSIDFKFRNQVWKLLTSLITLQNDDPLYEKEYAREEWDELGLTNGTTDEQTFDSVIEYIRWCDKHAGEKKFFDPDAKNLITRYLDQKMVATISRQIVLGRHLATLYYFDIDWIRKRLDYLFNNQNENLSKAAWRGYLTEGAYAEIFKDLALHYETHIRGTDFPALKNDELLEADKRVINHITTCYLHQIKEAENIFTKMIDRCHEKVCYHCAWIISMVLQGHKEKPSDSFNIEAFRKIWESSPLTGNPELLRWVKYSPFSKKETLELLYNSLDKSPNAIASIVSFEELVSYVDAYPQLTLECLDLFIRNRSRDVKFYIVGNELKDILRILLENDETKQRTTSLIHYLGEHKLYEYGDLL